MQRADYGLPILGLAAAMVVFMKRKNIRVRREKTDYGKAAAAMAGGCIVKFPERVWEQSEGGWYSRPATPYDWEQRKKLAADLCAVLDQEVTCYS
jgi:hypothetical protein